MKKRVFSMLSILVMLSLVFTIPASAKDKSEGALKPGQIVTYSQKVPINIVFIGYDKKDIDKQTILNELPATYTPIVRYPPFYGIPGRDMGLKFNFDYNFSFKDNDFSKKFFSYMKGIAVQGNPTYFQTAYNDQVNNVLDVKGPVLYIDAPSVENWLSKNLGSTKGYTIVFINWYNRPDFKFHVYTKTDQADPDTGYNFGANRDSRKLIAWGGTNSRLWFYDLSAGPEAWTNNWNVDNPDLDGNGVEDYRMPPIWEYTAGGYRDPSALSGDLGWVTRFVGIDLLFTTSPLYDPMVTAPSLGGDKIIHLSMLEDDPASQGTDWINNAFVKSRFTKFEPYYDWKMTTVDHKPAAPDAHRALQIFGNVLAENDCWNDYFTTFAQLFCYFDQNLSAYVPDYAPADYVAPIFAYNTAMANLGTWSGLLGFTDDNWVDGTQSYIYEFDTPEYRSAGYGFSTTTIHEAGHLFGLSHPHDGYDPEYGFDFSANDSTYFAWSGDESNTIMQYIDLSTEFGQFDQDNMYRYEMAGYLNWSNTLLASILADPNASHVRKNIERANQYADQALAGFNGWKYLAAASNARRAYEELSSAASQLGISTPSMNMLRMTPNGTAPREGDPIRFPDN